MQKPSWRNCITDEVTEIPRCFSISIQSEVAAGPLALDLAGLGDSPAVEQRILRQCSFTGVRVRNDGECPPPGFFF